MSANLTPPAGADTLLAMPARKVLVLEKKESDWVPFLEEFFEDTGADVTFSHDAASAQALVERIFPDILFFNSNLLAMPLAQKFKAFKQSTPAFRIFQLGPAQRNNFGLPIDDLFETVPSLILFQKQLVQHLPLPETVNVLVIDDEHEIGSMVRDFLASRVHPSFAVEYVDNGKKGIEAMEKKKPDVVVLDVKMPVMDGREVYREMARRGLKIPVVVFFDAISGDEMVEIHKVGRPAVVDKGSRQSAMPEMMALIKKMAYFG